MAPPELILGLDDFDTAKPTQKRRRHGRANALTSSSSFAPGRRGRAEGDDGEGHVDVKPEPGKKFSKTKTGQKRRSNDGEDREESVAPLAVGVDHGMTYSGLAESLVTKFPEEVDANMEWPGSDERHFKVPNKIAYGSENEDNHSFEDRESLFGFEVQEGMPHHTFMKRSLDKNALDSKFDDPVLKSSAGTAVMRMPSDHPPERANVDSMRHLYKTFVDKMILVDGEALYKKTRIIFVITHPAGCSEQGKMATREAAKDAGFGSRRADEIRTLSEAEAAALAAFAANRRKWGTAAFVDCFNAGTNICVMDVGGLTADSATYKIVAVDPYLKIKEACIPDGGKCGVIAIYCRFHEFCARLFGRCFTDLPLEEIGHGSALLQGLERQLRKFTGKDLNRQIRIGLIMDGVRDNPAYDKVDGQIIVTGRQLKEIMDETVQRIWNILENQFSEAKIETGVRVATVILCGGGSLFPYIHGELAERCKNILGERVQVLRPKESLSLVAIGGAISALRRKVLANRISRGHYGTEVHPKAKAKEVGEPDTWTCPLGGLRRGGFLHWHIRKGDIINPDAANRNKDRVKLKGYMTIEEDTIEWGKFERRITLYAYYGGGAAPTRVDAPGVRALGHLDIDIENMSSRTMKEFKTAVGGSASGEAKIPIILEQLQSNDKGVLEFVAKIATKIIGSYELKFAATAPA